MHCTRGYAPFKLTHYLAPWAGRPERSAGVADPRGGVDEWDQDRLDEWCILPWQGFERHGARVFVGEWGCFHRTPHARDAGLDARHAEPVEAAGWGWALWCLRGSFGILDSERSDVAYEEWRGHKLDRKMLELLREF